MANVDLFLLDQSIWIKGDDAAARTITIGQQVTNSDVLVINTEKVALTSAGFLTLAAGISCPAGTGTNSERYGVGSLASIVDGNDVFAFGKDAANSLTTADNVVAFGSRAAQSLTTNGNVVAIGTDAAQDVDATTIVAIGAQAFQHGTGPNNLAIGGGALLGDATNKHTGQFNTAIGANSLKSMDDSPGFGWNNIAIGGNALRDGKELNGNIVIGKDGMLLANTCVNNVMIGNGNCDAMTTGDSNIFIGGGVGSEISGEVNNQLRINFSGGAANIPLISGIMATSGGKMGINTFISNDNETTPSELVDTLTITTEDGDNINCLKLQQEDNGEAFIDFDGTEAAGSATPLSSRTAAGPPQGFVQIEANQTKEWVQRVGDPADPALTLGAAAATFAATTQYMKITGDAGANTIGTITGGVAGMHLYLLFVDGLVTITDTDASTADTVDLAGTATNFTSAADTVLHLVHDGNKWFEVSRSVN